MTVHSSLVTGKTPFGYTCRRCSRCCQHKHIQLDPYEVARLAQAKGQSVRQFREAWTVDGQGVALEKKKDGTCVFLGPKGCEVHADRPLVCRLYPLGRHVRQDGFEYYSILEGHPLSEGEFNQQGTIEEFVVAQGAKPFIVAADNYFRWLCSAYERLETGPGEAASQGSSMESDLLDIDDMVARHCAETGEPEPQNVDDRHRLHLRLLYDLIADRRRTDVEEEPDSNEDMA
jgi:Fe-S-cluster containining protein